MARALIYRILDAALKDERLNTVDRLVLVVLTKYANTDGSWCVASNSTIASCCAVSPRTVMRSILKLQDLGLVTRRRRPNQSAVTTVVDPEVTTETVLEMTGATVPENPEVTTETSGSDNRDIRKCHPCHPTVPSTAPSTDKHTCKSQDAEPESGDPSFDDWYSQYPKKKGRKAAEAAWKKMSKSDRRAAIEALPRHIVDWAESKTALQFIKYPATWLNGRTWEDELVRPDETLADIEKQRVIADMERQHRDDEARQKWIDGDSKTLEIASGGLR